MNFGNKPRSVSSSRNLFNGGAHALGDDGDLGGHAHRSRAVVHPRDDGLLDLSAPETWPSLMNLAEVAQVLRYADHDTVRDLTELPIDHGGLRYVSVGVGRMRRKRLVMKVDLLDFLSRNSVSQSRTEEKKQMRRK